LITSSNGDVLAFDVTVVTRAALEGRPPLRPARIGRRVDRQVADPRDLLSSMRSGAARKARVRVTARMADGIVLSRTMVRCGVGGL
jgi:hypothetical protein